MTLDRVARGARMSLFAAALVAVPALASAQVGTLAGRVVGPDGKPVPDAEVTLVSPAVSQQAVTKTNAKGEWVRAGLMTGNPWNISVKKGDLVGGMNGIRVPLNTVLEVPPITLRGAAPPPSTDPAAIKRMEAEKARDAMLAKIGKEVDAALAVNDYDTAIAKFTEAANAVSGCGICYARIGDLYMKKPAPAEAEKAYLRAIELDPQLGDSYSALASLYNTQRKFDEAAKMSAKAASLGGGSGGGNAEASFNAGAIAFNQGKVAEAKPFIQKALEANPNLAEAHYLYGMILINEGNMADAKKSLSEYLKLAPTGTNAATAKAILDSMP